MIQKWRDYFTDECDTCGEDFQSVDEMIRKEAEEDDD